jgi:predicted RNase H-like HicB family nuclease/DNA-binding Xre family transcriptional regulator
MHALERLRRSHGLSQRDLAKQSGVSPTTIYELETGRRPEPRPSTLRKLAEALGVEVADLLEDESGSPASIAIAGGGEKFTAIYELTEDGWWVVSVPEIPGAHSQGETLEEAREMIRDAVRMLLEVRREDAERETEGKKNVVWEPLEV